ncbi:hypothetical protein C0214_22925 [Methylobacterium sp. DM1]|nr:hypothetical protein C0214_22925 [Methylobacterium sp. DM1]
MPRRTRNSQGRARQPFGGGITPPRRRVHPEVHCSKPLERLRGAKSAARSGPRLLPRRRAERKPEPAEAGAGD